MSFNGRTVPLQGTDLGSNPSISTNFKNANFKDSCANSRHIVMLVFQVRHERIQIAVVMRGKRGWEDVRVSGVSASS